MRVFEAFLSSKLPTTESEPPGWVSLGLLTVYLLNSFVLYLYGE